MPALLFSEYSYKRLETRYMHTVLIPPARTLPSIDANEIAFAMALFVGAANGRIYAPDIGASGFPLSENLYEVCDGDFGNAADMDEGSRESSTPAPLSRAISVLWHHYNGDERQRAIWSRVVAFHAMMVGSKGAVVDHWTVPCAESPAEVSLSSAVVNAVATAPLGEFGQFDTLDFVRVVKEFDAQLKPIFAPVSDKRSLSYPSIGVSEDSTQTDGVSQNDVAESVLITQTNTAASAVSQEVRKFSAFERLNQPLGAVVGSAGFRAMFSRAVAINRAEFPWLSSLKITSDGRVLGFGAGAVDPGPASLAQAEVALVTSLLELLRQFVGDGVTLRLLQTVAEVIPPNYINQQAFLQQHVD